MRINRIIKSIMKYILKILLFVMHASVQISMFSILSRKSLTTTVFILIRMTFLIE